MGELRKDYFLDRFVIINPERAKRPHDFSHPPATLTKATVFAPGNEKDLPPIIVQYPNNDQWQFRVVPNKFAIVSPQGEPELRTDKIFTFASNYGHHEIVIEGREDAKPFSALGPSGISQALKVAIDRVIVLQNRPHIESVAYFKNEGPEAGASINHPHSQIIAMSVVPASLQRLFATHAQLRSKFGFSPLYKILDHERGGPRIVAESKHFVLLCPYASRFPLEVMIIPLRDSPSYTTLTDEERDDLAQHLAHVLGKLSSLAAPFNVEWIHSKNNPQFHWYASITPRLSIWAGYEIETNIIVNPIPPEDAAAFYRAP